MPLSFSRFGPKARGSTLHSIKLTQGILPVNHRVSRYTEFRDSSCPFCSEEETQLHYFKCNHCSKLEWRTTLFRSLRALKVSHPLVRNVIVQELECWWNDATYPEHAQLPDTLYTAVISQRIMGWYPFILGYTSKLWLDYSTQLSPHNQNSTIRKIVACIWKAEQKLWKQRNQSQHKSTDALHRTSHHRELQQRISVYYEYKNDTELQRLRPTMFRQPLDAFLKQPYRVMKNWIRAFEPILRVHIRRSAKNRAQGLQSIVNFF